MAIGILVHNTSLLLEILGLTLLKTPLALFRQLVSTVKTLGTFLYIGLWDTGLFTLNVILPDRKKGNIVLKGVPGHAGIWPAFVAPTESDSRSPCPYLNALANHGILPRNGRGISMQMLREVMGKTLNFAPSMTLQTTNGVEGLFQKNVINLSDFNEHRVIEHDASLIRHDAYFQPNQAIPPKDLINRFLSTASRGPTASHPQGALSAQDISAFLSKRIAESKRDNPTWNGLTTVHWLFMVNNSAILFDTTDGDVQVLRTILLEERFPDGYESWNHQPFGYTVLDFQLRSLQIFLGIRS